METHAGIHSEKGNNEEENETLLGLPPPKVESGKLPTYRDWMRIILEAACCCGFLMVVSLLGIILLFCFIIGVSNTNSVRTMCPGYWEFCLIGLLTPFLVTGVYCIYACCFFFILGWWNWHVYFGTCMFVMGVVGIHMSVVASENSECIVALEQTTKYNFPFLLYVGYMICILCFSGSFSSFYYYLSKRLKILRERSETSLLLGEIIHASIV